ncbi:response regulator [uncultured Desulfobacter sp.]|jgi:CheY-like chemotaxis protein|uniref:response regulator n=1 Tax=uncultured Desulfobacter sp. TaxID=240139 RepID=UPI0029C900DD|nr:response regulator [uncultured Desulfobacter sp.]
MKQPIKVLMVDDEKRFRETTRKILERNGFETILAENGAKALQCLDQSPDVAILDIRMPGMDGHEVLEKMIKLKPDLPVIMLTGHGDKDSAEQSLVLGAFDYLSKPCDIDLLSDKIREACRSKEQTGKMEEDLVGSAMIPLSAYTTIDEHATIAESIQELKASFVTLPTSDLIMETGHRSILVMDKNSQIQGILTIRDLLKQILPGYLTSTKPSTADSIQYSPMFWRGMFTSAVEQIGTLTISEIMSPVPVSIDAESTLMEAAWIMVDQHQRRLIVTEDGKSAGVIREQDLFFQMGKHLIPPRLR